MTCTQYGGGVVVCRGRTDGLRKRYIRCPICECTTEMVANHQDWYGTTLHCCRCGDSWDEDGYLMERPFARGWRARAVQRHRAMWDRATFGPAPVPLDLVEAGGAA